MTPVELTKVPRWCHVRHHIRRWSAIGPLTERSKIAASAGVVCVNAFSCDAGLPHVADRPATPVRSDTAAVSGQGGASSSTPQQANAGRM